ncbi:MAG: diacylglycerol kinase family protein [Patescibacteria group bacterium]
MYLYIYDEFVQEKRHEREVASIENRLTDLGITGKIIRLALFKRADEQIRDEARRGVSTVVVVGNDHTVRKVLDAVVEVGLPLGMIPVGGESAFARMIGVSSGVASCDVLSARVIQQVDVGLLNGKRFVAGLRVLTPEAELFCDGRYRVTLTDRGTMEIHNFTTFDAIEQEEVGNPQDGTLDAVIRTDGRRSFFRRKQSCQTRLPIHTAFLQSKHPIRVLCDGEEMRADQFQIGVEEGTLKVITGRARKF